MLTDENKETRKTIISKYLQGFNLEAEKFLGKNVSGDKIWVYFFEWEAVNGV